MINFAAHNLWVSKAQKDLVKNASFDISPGNLTVLLGPNGAGKTTLLQASMGLIPTDKGEVILGGANIKTLSALTRARHVAYLPQSRPLAWPARVKDVVALGRFAHGASLSKLGADDQAAVDKAMTDCDLGRLSDRRADTLSGGERARMHCARAFAAQAPLLIADEPVAALDPRHQFRVMDLIRNYVNTGGGAMVVLHDLSLAAQYANNLIWMKDGEITASGSTKDTLTEARIAEVYGVKARVSNNHIALSGPV